MAKERIILAFIAIASGLIVASSIFYFYQQKSTSQNLPTPEASPAASLPNTSPLLEIESPEDELVTDAKKIEIKGKTLAQSLIVLTTNNEDFVLTAEADGMFRKTISLDEDENLITITAYTESGTSETKELLIAKNQEEF